MKTVRFMVSAVVATGACTTAREPAAVRILPARAAPVHWVVVGAHPPQPAPAEPTLGLRMEAPAPIGADMGTNATQVVIRTPAVPPAMTIPPVVGAHRHKRACTLPTKTPMDRTLATVRLVTGSTTKALALHRALTLRTATTAPRRAAAAVGAPIS